MKQKFNVGDLVDVRSVSWGCNGSRVTNVFWVEENLIGSIQDIYVYTGFLYQTADTPDAPNQDFYSFKKRVAIQADVFPHNPPSELSQSELMEVLNTKPVKHEEIA